MFHEKFKSYVCEFDRIGCEVDGITYFANVIYDQYTKPTDFECYDDDEIAAFNNGDWFYCGIVISAHVDGVMIADHCASLWGIEANITDDNDYLRATANDLLDEARDHVKPIAKALAKKLELAQ